MNNLSNLPPLLLLRRVMRAFPRAGRQCDLLRAARLEPDSGITWPDWCFLPMSAATAIVTQGRDLDFQRVSLAEAGWLYMLSPVLAWRVSQDIVRFDADVYSALTATPLADDAPDILFRQLPAWCMYIELEDDVYHGFFVHLEFDARTQEEELRLLFLPHDPDGIPMPHIIHLGYGSIKEGHAAFLRQSRHNFKDYPDAQEAFAKLEADLASTDKDVVAALSKTEKLVTDALSLTLYLCSTAPEWSGTAGECPSKPSAKKVKGGWRLFPPDQPRIWNVGTETGIKIRAARAAHSGGERQGTRPHIRRAHWHTYWTGRRVWKEGENPIPQSPKINWLAPIAVALKEDDNE